jgi:hypothetical protein
VKYDETGHIHNVSTHTVTMPKGSLSDTNTNGADVIIQLAFNDATGALSTTRTNISNLLLTDYSKKTNSDDIAATDALGDALSKLQTQIHIEENTRESAISTEALSRATADNALQEALDAEVARAIAAEEKALTDAKAYTDAVKKAILIGDSSNELSDTYDTLLEISNWINGDGVNTTELTAAIAEETQARVNAINALGSAAYRDEVYFVSKEKYDNDMSVKDAQIIGLNTEAKRLTNEVNDLRNRLIALEQLLQSQPTE